MATKTTNIAIKGPVILWGTLGLVLIAALVIRENTVPKEKRWFSKLDNPGKY